MIWIWYVHYMFYNGYCQAVLENCLDLMVKTSNARGKQETGTEKPQESGLVCLSMLSVSYQQYTAVSILKSEPFPSCSSADRATKGTPQPYRLAFARSVVTASNSFLQWSVAMT
jgi:hypothetical protein